MPWFLLLIRRATVFARLEPASNVWHLMLPGCDHHPSHPAQRQDAKSAYLNELHSALLLPLAISVQL